MDKLLSIFGCLIFLVSNLVSQENNQITYIANEGVFIEYQGKKVYIDALHRKYTELYQFTRANYAREMIQGTAPFDSVNLMLVTHLHGDHFHIGDTKDLLANNYSIKLMAPQQVIDTMGQLGYLKNQIYPVPSKSQGLIYQMDGLDITTFPLLHSYPQKNHSIENTAYLLDFKGLRILHVGDAELLDENFNRIQSAVGKRGVDYALLPDWFFAEGDHLKMIKTKIKAKKYIAIHVSKLETGFYEKKVKKRVKDLNLDLNVFMRVGETEPLQK